MARRPSTARRPATGAPVFAYIGSFTTEKRQGRGAGITVWRVDGATGRWTPEQTVGDLVNPSWLLTNRAGTVLYATQADGEHASSFAIDRASGRIEALNRVATGGLNGVSAKLDRTERFMVLANYGSGQVAVLPVAVDGALGEPVQIVELPGEGRKFRRIVQQESAHPHDVMFDPSGRFVAVPDKGLDGTFLFRFDADTGRLSPAGPGFTPHRAGAGPRHALFHPHRATAWVLNELDSTITTCRVGRATGRLTPLDVVSTLPGDFAGDNQAAELAFLPSGNTLYASNRGHDSIVRCRVHPETGIPRPVDWIATRGAKPRFITLDLAGRTLYAANQDGDTITAFAVAPRTGALSPLRRTAKTGSPVSIVFVPGVG